MIMASVQSFFCGELPSFGEKYFGKYYSVTISLFLFAIKRRGA
jgi:hypothetical protein